MDGELWLREAQRISIETEAACDKASRSRVRNTPSAIYRPALMQDGDQFLAILGDIATGVVGCGESPEKAFADFDRAWKTPAVSLNARTFPAGSELLAALKAMVAIYDGLRDVITSDVIRAKLSAADAAIAKAEGLV